MTVERTYRPTDIVPSAENYGLTLFIFITLLNNQTMFKSLDPVSFERHFR